MKLVNAVLISILLTACSSGGGSSVNIAQTASLPPEPDRAANNKTLAGIDTTGTGVRDDVYRYIFQNYTSTHKRNAMMQSAKAFRKIYIAPPTTKTEALAIAKDVHRSVDCFFSYASAGHYTSDDAYSLLVNIRTLHTDTKERMKAFDSYNQLLDGTGGPVTSTAGSCDAGGGL